MATPVVELHLGFVAGVVFSMNAMSGIKKSAWILGLYRLVALLAILTQSSFAGIRPSFSLDHSSWHATHIVLVITTPTDGTFEVVESWKGDLRSGEWLVVPELRPSPNAIPLFRYPTSWAAAYHNGVSEQVPRQPVGSRMVLFLKRAHTQADVADEPAGREWKPSDIMDTMTASAVWFDSDQVYCFTQLMNPGPSVLFPSRDSAGTLHDRVIEIKGIQADMTAALAAPDGAQRAELLKPYVRSDAIPVRRFALEELGKMGSSAVPTIREMLDDPSFADEASELVKALVKAGGEALGEELNRRLQQDLAFWKATGPSLAPNWWNLDARPHAPLRERYSQTYQLILGLQKARYPAVEATAIQLRDFWRSLPQLNDPSGLNQMAEECDKLIRLLQSTRE